ncbi:MULTISPECIES: restriction endonuclease subunit S [unclassified Paenibacillus]|uniref:restriction endonuclease subunit S n=1 Tax=unclassified Paenibacillus TaxID=185978 RepID=UPI00362A4049
MSNSKVFPLADNINNLVLVKKEEQPFEIPEGWNWVTIGSICTLINGFVFKPSDWTETGLPIIRIQNLNADNPNYRNFNYYQGEIDPKYIVNEGDLLFAWSGNIGTSFGSRIYSGPTGVLNQHIFKVHLKEFVIKEYFYYCIQSRIDAVHSNTHGGAGLVHITKGKLESIAFPLPPLNVQKRIVKRVESFFAKLDKVNELVLSSLDTFETRKFIILQKAFTGELSAKWREQHGVGMASWEKKLFSEICNIVRGGSPRPAGDPQYYGGNIPFLKVADITRNDGPFVSSAEHSIKEAGLKKTRMVEANTLLLTNSGATLGVPAISSFQTTFNDGIAAFLNLDKRSLKFFYYFWISKTSELRAINKGAAQPNLNTDIIGAVIINLPTIEEQQEIVRILDSLFESEKKAKELCDVIDKVDLMKKEILARAIRGELGTNDFTQESSLEL